MMPLLWKFIQAQPWPQGRPPLPLWQVHRGWHLEGLRQNSRASFQEARRRGFQMCETDLRWTADEVPVLFHDESFLSKQGTSLKVRQLSLKELRSHVEVDTLAETLMDSEVTPFFNLELKPPEPRDLGAFEKKVVEVVRACGAEDRVIFSAFHPLTILALEMMAPEVPRFFLVDLEGEPIFRQGPKPGAFAPLLKIHGLNISQGGLTDEILAELRRRNFPFYVWTVNDPATADRLLQAGAHGLISDRCQAPFFNRGAATSS